MNGWDWRFDAACQTDGASYTVVGPVDLVRMEVTQWLGEHDRHEFTFKQAIVKPPPETQEGAIDLQVPEWERTVPVE